MENAKPFVQVYRKSDVGPYLLMEFAEVDPGHSVAWGKRLELSREDARTQLRDLVVASLQSFRSRDGNDRAGRLKMKGVAWPLPTSSRVLIQLLNGATLKITPCRSNGRNIDSFDERAIDLASETDHERFFEALDDALDHVCEPVAD